MFLDPKFWLQLALLALAAWCIWGLVGPPRWDARIVADARGLRSRRGIADREVGKLRRFFTEEIQLRRKVIIYAQRDRRGNIRVRCCGRLDFGTKQRIRNFIASLM